MLTPRGETASLLQQSRDATPPVPPRAKIAGPGVVRAEFRVQKLVGGPGFEPGASRSRTLRMSCPRVSRGFL